jgi:hypothetical protein
MLLACANSVSPNLDKYCDWLTAGIGAVLGLMLANLSSLNEMIDTWCLKGAFAWLIASLVLGLIARLLSVGVVAGIAAAAAGAKMAEDLEGDLDIHEMFEQFTSGLFWPNRVLLRLSIRKVESGDHVAGARYIAKQSQLQSLAVLAQVICIAVAIGSLANGIVV